MKTKLFQKNLIIYELYNTFGNFFAVFFGGIFPIVMTIIFIAAFSSQAGAFKDALATQIFISNASMIPLALVFVGFSSTFSQELEQGVTQRMNLFGYSNVSMLSAKLIANLIVVTIGYILYTLVVCLAFPVLAPTVFSAVLLIASLYIMTILFFVLAYGIAMLTKRFGPCYAITMTIYFSSMILSGMMGLTQEMMPAPMKFLANLLPTAHIAQDFPKIWQSTSYNFMPFLQSMIFLAAVSGIVLAVALYRNRRL
ncbi:ABC transporter permease [Culicoidibacter larvae]|nr:ABC transporter permease [Culicoidibacter larvae]